MLNEEEERSYLEFIDRSELETAKEGGIPLKDDDSICWREGDEVIRMMQADRMSKDEEIPSMWNYDGGSMPKEFVDLTLETFLVDPGQMNICCLDKEILAKICKNLEVTDFLNLSLTCRYLHWRMFVYCRCYSDCSVLMMIVDRKVAKFCPDRIDPWIFEISGNKTLYNLSLEEEDRRRLPRLESQEGERVVFAHVPSCLRRPFYFSELEISLKVPFFKQADIDRWLPYIQSAQKHVKRSTLDIWNENRIVSEEFFNYPALEAFFQIVNADTILAYDRVLSRPFNDIDLDRFLRLFEHCPYTHTVSSATIHFDNNPLWENCYLPHPVGWYMEPPVSAIIRTIREIVKNPRNFIKHKYSLFDVGKQIAFLEYFFANYLNLLEYVCEWGRRSDDGYIKHQTALTTTFAGRNGQLLLLETVIRPRNEYGTAKVTVVTLKNWNQEGLNQYKKADNGWMMVETAMEPEEKEEETRKEQEEDEEEMGRA